MKGWAIGCLASTPCGRSFARHRVRRAAWLWPKGCVRGTSPRWWCWRMPPACAWNKRRPPPWRGGRGSSAWTARAASRRSATRSRRPASGISKPAGQGSRTRFWWCLTASKTRATSARACAPRRRPGRPRCCCRGGARRRCRALSPRPPAARWSMCWWWRSPTWPGAWRGCAIGACGWSAAWTAAGRRTRRWTTAAPSRWSWAARAAACADSPAYAATTW